MIETNIDDMNPQFYEYIMEKTVLRRRARCFPDADHHEESRPGLVLSVIAAEDGAEPLISILLRETTTLGVRISEYKKRMILGREIVSVETAWGAARVKIRSVSDTERTISPNTRTANASPASTESHPGRI